MLDPDPNVTPDPNAPPADWRATLPESYERRGADGKATPVPLRGAKTLEKFKDPGGLAQGYIELEQAHSAKLDGLVRIPGADAKPEDVAAYRKALGIPENVAEYKVDVPEGLRSLVPLDVAAKFAPIFHAAHVPAPVAQQIVQAYGEHAQAVLTARQQEFAAGRDALKQEWGEATFTRRTALAERAVEQLLSDAQIALFNQAGLSGHPELFKLFASLGETMAEDGLISGEVIGGKTQAQMIQRKLEIEADPDFHNQYKNPAKNAMLVKEWNDIFKELNPEPIGASR